MVYRDNDGGGGEDRGEIEKREGERERKIERVILRK